MESLDLRVLADALAWRRGGHGVTLVTVVETWGSAPRPPGALLAVRDDGVVSGSVSGGCVEDDLIARVKAGERTGRPSMIAYGVSRYRILSEVRMFQLLMLRMIPPIVVVAPLSLYYTAVGLIDTRFGLILVYFLTTLPYAVWMTKSFIDEVPLEVEQAAEILGASRWRTVFEIVLPLIRSGLVATFLFILILTWSEYLLALIITKTQVTTLPIELSKYQGSTEGRVYGRQAALAVGITVPLMIVGLIIRKHLARGFSFGMVRR